LQEAGPIEQFQVAIAALGTLMNGPSVPSMPIPVLVLYGSGDRMSRGESWPDAWSAAVKSLRVPAASSELLGTLLGLLEKSSSDAGRAPRKRRAGAPPFPGLRVLVAEDNPVNQRVATLILERLGCAVDIACDGAQAVEMWSRRTYDAVLMDCQMPELDGFEATAAIRRAERTLGNHIPIIAMTANAMTGDRERCLRAGMDSYLSKPVSVDQITRTLREFAAGSRSEDPAAEPSIRR
jgi:CheY-like chemotaxis protein